MIKQGTVKVGDVIQIGPGDEYEVLEVRPVIRNDNAGPRDEYRIEDLHGVMHWIGAFDARKAS
jgi:hypothetical protein